jgi:hypothetical protein
MKKVLLSVIGILSFGFSNAQSNDKGTIHVNLTGGLFVGSSKFVSTVEGEDDAKFGALGGNYGLDFQYGLTQNFSAGIGIGVGAYVFTPKVTSTGVEGIDGLINLTPNLSVATFKVNASGRYYIVNKDSFNFFAGPSVGFVSGKNTLDLVLGELEAKTDAGKFSGLNLGLNAGINYYFTDTFGGTFQVGYDTNLTKTKDTEVNGVKEEGFKNNFGGVLIQAGLALKF